MFARVYECGRASLLIRGAAVPRSRAARSGRWAGLVTTSYRTG